MKLNRHRLQRARARRREEDRLVRESILPVAGPGGVTLGLIAAIGEGPARRYFVVREGRRGYLLPVEGPFVMLAAALRSVFEANAGTALQSVWANEGQVELHLGLCRQ